MIEHSSSLHQPYERLESWKKFKPYEKNTYSVVWKRSKNVKHRTQFMHFSMCYKGPRNVSLKLRPFMEQK